MLVCFSLVLGLLWGAYSCLFGFGRFRCFVFLVVLVFFCLGFVFEFCFVFVLLLDCFGGCSCFVFWVCPVFLFLFVRFVFVSSCLFFVLKCFLFFYCCVFLGCFCFVLCLLEWSRCCSSFVLFCLFCLCLFFCFFVFVSFCFLWKSHFPCNSSVFYSLKSESLFLISVSGSCFLFLVWLHLFQDVLLFLFSCLFSCFVLNHNIIFVA